MQGMLWASPGKDSIDFCIKPWTDGWGSRYIMPEINAIWLHHFPGNKYAAVTAAIPVSFISNSKHNAGQLNTSYFINRVIKRAMFQSRAASISIGIANSLYCAHQNSCSKLLMKKKYKEISCLPISIKWHQELFQIKYFSSAPSMGYCLKANFSPSDNQSCIPHGDLSIFKCHICDSLSLCFGDDTGDRNDRCFKMLQPSFLYEAGRFYCYCGMCSLLKLCLRTQYSQRIVH